MNKIKLGDTVMLWSITRTNRDDNKVIIFRDINDNDIFLIESWAERQTLDPDIYAWAVSIIIESSDY
jgi:hypothetical protein